MKTGLVIIALLFATPAMAQQVSCEDQKTIVALRGAIAQQEQFNADLARQLQVMGLAVPAPATQIIQKPPSVNDQGTQAGEGC